MKKLLIALIIVSSVKYIYAQDFLPDSTDLPIIHSQVVPQFGGRVYYRFPVLVELELSAYFQQSGILNEKNKCIFIRLGTLERRSKLTILKYDCSLPIDSTSSTELIISCTNRFFKIGSNDIPIIFDADRIFSFYNVSVLGEAFHLNFEGKFGDIGNIIN